LKYRYDTRTAQYRGTDGRFVSVARIAELVADTGNQLRDKLGRHADALLANKISVAEFQLRMARDIKTVHIQMALLANPSLQGSGTATGREVKEQIQRLGKFGDAIAGGNLSEAQIRQRARMYANSITPSFYRAQIESRKRSQVKTGRRVLDNQAHHCSDCLMYAGLGWVKLSDLIAPGTECECSYGCRCSIVYRYY
jgi:hypothetical protein